MIIRDAFLFATAYVDTMLDENADIDYRQHAERIMMKISHRNLRTFSGSLRVAAGAVRRNTERNQLIALTQHEMYNWFAAAIKTPEEI